MTKTLAALAFTAILGLAALATQASAWTCSSYRSGSYTYTNCN